MPAAAAALLSWLLFALLWPVLWWQGRQARRSIPRLPEAPGARADTTDWRTRRAAPLLLIGDSPMAGVGVESFAQSLPARIAARAPCHWQARAATGLRLEDLPALCGSARPRMVIAMAGVNDVTALGCARRWRDGLRRLLAVTAPARLVLIGVPPIRHFPALPRPLRDWLGLRAIVFDGISRRVLARHGRAYFVPIPALREPALMARDGFHPSAAGAEALARHLVDVLDEAGWWAVLDSNQRPAD